jgi:transposase-like protein
VATLKQVARQRWEWTEQKREALVLLTTGGLTYQQVADRLGVGRETLWYWRRSTEFANELNQLNDMLAAEVQQLAIGRKHERMSAKQARWEAFHRIVEKRREAGAGGGPGLDSGFVVKRYKSIGSGPAAYAEIELEFDAALARAFDSLEKEASIEAGQRVERQEVDANTTVHQGPATTLRFFNQSDRKAIEAMDDAEKAALQEDGVDVDTREVEVEDTDVDVDTDEADEDVAYIKEWSAPESTPTFEAANPFGDLR